MRRIAFVVLLFACASCVQTGDEGVQATVSDAELTTHRDKIGAGATVSIGGAGSVEDIELLVRFMNGGEVVREETDVLPFCSASSDPCLWGASFVIDDPVERTADRAEVQIRRYSRSEADDPVEGLGVRITGGRIAVELPGEAGNGILVALRDGDPVYGIAFEAEAGEKELTFSEADVPANDGVRARFYPGAEEGGGD